VRELQGHGSGLDGVWGNEAIWKLRMDREGLRRVGGCCEALYLDMMVVRDEGMLCSFPVGEMIDLVWLHVIVFLKR